MLSETWLDSDERVSIPNFDRCVQFKRPDRRAAGVAIHRKQKNSHAVTPHMNITYQQVDWVLLGSNRGVTEDLHCGGADSIQSVGAQIPHVGVVGSKILQVMLPYFDGRGSLVVKVAGLVTSSSPIPLKTRRVGEGCTLNRSRAQTSSCWCSVVVRRGDANSDGVLVTGPWFKMTWSVAKKPSCS
ncbi:uncharacterized protein TNCV_3204111 [Trichonephila clavipes]|nr:uncharacterized protein TNCV_3204111 [Trichonephila clavipes]